MSHIFGVLSVFDVLFEPHDQLPQGREMLVVEEQATRSDPDWFLDHSPLLIDVEQYEILRVFFQTAEEIVDVRWVYLHFCLYFVLELFDVS